LTLPFKIPNNFLNTDLSLKQSYETYNQTDILFFEQLYSAAVWEMDEGHSPGVPVRMGPTMSPPYGDYLGYNWEASIETRRYKDLLLRGYQRSSGTFFLTTRDIVIFWGRVSSQLLEDALKFKFCAEGCDDAKNFLSSLLDCLLDTLKFEFDEALLGIISIRTKVVGDLERWIMSFLCDLEQMQDDADKHDKQKSSENVDRQGITPQILPSRWKAFFAFFKRFQASQGSALGNLSLQQNDQEKMRSPYTSKMHSDVLNVVYTKRTFDILLNAEFSDPSVNQLCNVGDVLLLPQDRRVIPNGFDIKNPKCIVCKEVMSSLGSTAKVSSCMNTMLDYQAFLNKDSTSEVYKYAYLDYFVVEGGDAGRLARTGSALKEIFRGASGSLLFKFCMVLEVLWKVKIDDQITEFIEKCVAFRNLRKSSETRLRMFRLGSEVDIVNLKNGVVKWYKAKEANVSQVHTIRFDHSKSVGSYSATSVDVFDLLPRIARTSKNSVQNMAVKLTFQRHSYAKTLFKCLEDTEIVESPVEVDTIDELFKVLSILRTSIEWVRHCILEPKCLSSRELLENEELGIVNETAEFLAEAWYCVEYLMALLSTKESYSRSVEDLQSWVDPIVCRLHLPSAGSGASVEDRERARDIINEDDGPPPWRESLEFVDCLQEFLLSVHPELRSFDDPPDSPYIVIRPRFEGSILIPNPLVMYCGVDTTTNRMTKTDGSPYGDAPLPHFYTCDVCNEPGQGYSWSCDLVDKNADQYTRPYGTFDAHPYCIYAYNLAVSDPDAAGSINSTKEAEYKAIWESNVAEYELIASDERKQFAQSGRG